MSLPPLAGIPGVKPAQTSRPGSKHDEAQAVGEGQGARAASAGMGRKSPFEAVR